MIKRYILFVMKLRKNSFKNLEIYKNQKINSVY